MNNKMNKIIIPLMLIFCITLVSATSYYTQINENIGTITNDLLKNVNITNTTSIEEQNNNSIKVGDIINVLGQADQNKDLLVASVSDLSAISDYVHVTDTAKKPIDYGPYIFWGIMGLVSLLILWGLITLYQFYFY